MKIIVYTLFGCSQCSTVKELFQRANTEYQEIVVRKDISVSDFRDLYPNQSGFPFVLIDDEPIGGLVETAKLFVEKGLVSSRKK